MTALGRLADALICILVRILCKVDGKQTAKVPMGGPLILIVNHVNFLEAPVLYCRLRPRRAIALAKAEAWDNRLLGWLFDQWGAIPIRRGETDISALRRALGVLRDSGILVVAPEGTRSRHGRLQRGRPGIVTIALKSGAPLLPLVFYGGEDIGRNVRRLRRTPFHVIVGEPFHLEVGEEKISRDVRQRIADEIMYRMSALLPPAYRGEYADLDAATDSYVRFASAAEHNPQPNKPQGPRAH
jgi:1-acyl-sn-glycerol-3-phosphate acyltransferase